MVLAQAKLILAVADRMIVHFTSQTLNTNYEITKFS